MYIMSYFTERELCARLAKSEDLLHWEDMNNGKPVVYKTSDTLIRDPFIIKDKNGIYHMLFTVNWNGNQLGHTTSTDLINWAETEFITVMPGDTQNVWAPECIYDEEGDEYILYWSSTVPKGEYNHRIYCCKTKDFKVFSKAVIFFDPGYTCIDADIIKVGDNFFMIYKDERGTHKDDTEGKKSSILPLLTKRQVLMKISEVPFLLTWLRALAQLKKTAGITYSLSLLQSIITIAS